MCGKSWCRLPASTSAVSKPNHRNSNARLLLRPGVVVETPVSRGGTAPRKARRNRAAGRAYRLLIYAGGNIYGTCVDQRSQTGGRAGAHRNSDTVPVSMIYRQCKRFNGVPWRWRPGKTAKTGRFDVTNSELRLFQGGDSSRFLPIAGILDHASPPAACISRRCRLTALFFTRGATS